MSDFREVNSPSLSRSLLNDALAEDEGVVVAEVFTPDEKRALELTGELAAVIQRVVGPNPETRADDINELYQALHVIQRAIQASALGRIVPHEVRGLGQPPIIVKQTPYRCELCWQPRDTLHTSDCSYAGLMVGDGP